MPAPAAAHCPPGAVPRPVCARARAFVCMHVRACVHVRAWENACACVRACVCVRARACALACLPLVVHQALHRVLCACVCMRVRACVRAFVRVVYGGVGACAWRAWEEGGKGLMCERVSVFLCVRVHICACVHACVRRRVRGRVRSCMWG